MGLDSKARSRRTIFGIAFWAALLPIGVRNVQMAPPTKAKPSSRTTTIAIQPRTDPTSGRVRKPAGAGCGKEMFELLGGSRYDGDVAAGVTMAGIVGERVAVELGREPWGSLRGTPVCEREGLTEPVIMRAAEPVARRSPPPASAGNRPRMVCASCVA